MRKVASEHELPSDEQVEYPLSRRSGWNGVVDSEVEDEDDGGWYVQVTPPTHRSGNEVVVE
jgi:hypothetical protein